VSEPLTDNIQNGALRDRITVTRGISSPLEEEEEEEEEEEKEDLFVLVPAVLSDVAARKFKGHCPFVLFVTVSLNWRGMLEVLSLQT
jgi:hypothetical protein